MHETGQKLKTIGILQPGYLPWLGFFEQIFRSDIFVIYDDVQFEKGSWRNRNRIKTPLGPVWLTVPVLSKGRGFPLIRDIEINNAVTWRQKHLKTIAQNYCKAAYFEKYFEKLQAILMKSHRYLMDLDLELIHWMIELLDIPTPLKLASELGVSGKSVNRLIDIIKTLGGNHFYEGAAGRNYILAEDFAKAGIKVTFQEYRHPVYPQLYREFVSHLSTLDLLFNCGEDSAKILTADQEGY